MKFNYIKYFNYICFKAFILYNININVKSYLCNKFRI